MSKRLLSPSAEPDEAERPDTSAENYVLEPILSSPPSRSSSSLSRPTQALFEEEEEEEEPEPFPMRPYRSNNGKSVNNSTLPCPYLIVPSHV